MVPAFPRDYTTAPARTRLPVIAAEAAIQDGTLPGTRMAPASLRDYTTAPAPTRLPVIAAEAAIQDGPLPGTRMVPPTLAALHITPLSGLALPDLGFLDCGLRRNDDMGGMTVGYLIPAWDSWIAASAAMTTRVA